VFLKFLTSALFFLGLCKDATPFFLGLRKATTLLYPPLTLVGLLS